MTRRLAVRPRPVAPLPYPRDFRDTVSALLPAAEAGDAVRRVTGWVVSPPCSDGDVSVQVLFFADARPFSARIAWARECLTAYRARLRAAGLDCAELSEVGPWMFVHPRREGSL